MSTCWPGKGWLGEGEADRNENKVQKEAPQNPKTPFKRSLKIRILKHVKTSIIKDKSKVLNSFYEAGTLILNRLRTGQKWKITRQHQP